MHPRLEPVVIVLHILRILLVLPLVVAQTTSIAWAYFAYLVCG